MEMKFRWIVFAAMAVFAGQVPAAQQVTTLATFQSGSPTTGANRVSIDSDGAIEAVRNEPGLTSHMTLRFVGRVAVITTNDGISSSTRLVNLDAMDAWNRSNPALASQVESTARLANDAKAIAPLRVDVQPMADRCQPQLNALLKAADGEVASCSMGGGIMCVLATEQYYAALDSYNQCMKGVNTPAQ